MSHWNPKTFWNELLKSLLGGDDKSRNKAADPSILFHLTFTAPILIGLIALAKRI